MPRLSRLIPGGGALLAMVIVAVFAWLARAELDEADRRHRIGGAVKNVRLRREKTEPGAGERGDARIRGARFPAGFGPLVRLVLGITRPRRRILGNTFAGIVEATGVDVQGFAAGDAVCGMTGSKFGTHAQFVSARADRVARMLPRCHC